MHSLKQQIMLLVIGPLLLLSVVGSILTGIYMKDRVVLATNTKATADLSTGEAIVELMYPGPWREVDGVLYKGNVKISNNFEPVDKIADLTGDTVTIFLGDTRASTTVREKSGERAIGTKVSQTVADKVLKNGQMYLGQANVVGELYQTAYKPLRSQNGQIIGMFYVGISKKLSEQLINNSIVTIVVFSIVLTFLVALIAWFYAQRAIVGPLKQITIGTQQVATGKFIKKLQVNTANNEIGELANALNQMIDGMQGFAMHIAKVAGTGGTETIEMPAEGVTGDSHTVNAAALEAAAAFASTEYSSDEKEDLKENIPQSMNDLPKGLNEATMKQIISYLNNNSKPMSAEEIGEGVNLTRVTARRYLEYLEKAGWVEMELKYGTVGRPVKLYRGKEQ